MCTISVPGESIRKRGKLNWLIDTHDRLFGSSPNVEQSLENYRKKVEIQTERDRYTDDWAVQLEKKILGEDVKREISKELDSREQQLQQRKEKLHKFLEEEENWLVHQLESLVEKGRLCVDHVNEFKKEREERRQQLVREKLNLQFTENCQELRTKFSAELKETVLDDRREQVRELESIRAMKKLENEYYDCLWHADYLKKLQREEQEALEKRAREMDMLTTLHEQVASKEMEKLNHRQLVREEAQLLEEQRKQLELEDKLEKEKLLEKKRELKAMLEENINKAHERREQERKENEEQDLQYKKMAENEKDSSEFKSKREKLKEEQQFLEQVAMEKKAREKREKESEKLIWEDSERIWKQELEKREKRQKWREELIRKVIEERRQQIQEKIDENARNEQKLLDEVKCINKMIEFNKQMAKEEEEEHKKAIKKYRADILTQISHQKEEDKWKRQQLDAEYERYKKQEEEYQQKLNEASTDKASTNLHKIRHCTAKTMRTGETDTISFMKKRLESLQDLVKEKQEKISAMSASTQLAVTCENLKTRHKCDNILAYYQD